MPELRTAMIAVSPPHTLDDIRRVSLGDAANPWTRARDRLVSGAHGAVLCPHGVELTGPLLRLAGFEVRDTLLWARGTTILPLLLVRVSLTGTVIESVVAHGTGALNIDACRVGYESGGTAASNPSLRTHINGGNGGKIFPAEPDRRVVVPSPDGRWPANVLLDTPAAALLDAQSGVRTSGAPGVMRKGRNDGASYGAESRPPGTAMVGYGDSGGASRFFSRIENGTELFSWISTLISVRGDDYLDPFSDS